MLIFPNKVGTVFTFGLLKRQKAIKCESNN